MNCTQAELWIQQSLDESLTSTEREILDAHLAGCPACAARWREYRALSRAAAQWAQKPVPISDDFTARLMAKIEDRAAASSPSSRVSGRQAAAPTAPSHMSWRSAAALAGFACAAGIAAWAWRFALPSVRLAPGDIAPDPRALQSAPSWLWDGVRELPSSLAHLQGAVPASAWALPICLIAFTANILLIHYARRRTV